MNGGLSKAVGSPAAPVPGTIWLSKVTTADTRKVMWEASCGSGVPVLGLFGMSSRCSWPPGRRCSRSASFWSIMAWPAARGSNRWPARTLTRSAVMPRARSGLDIVSTGVSGWRPRAGSVAWYSPVVDIAATCGSRASAAKYLVGSALPVGRSCTWAALAHCSSRG